MKHIDVVATVNARLRGTAHREAEAHVAACDVCLHAVERLLSAERELSNDVVAPAERDAVWNAIASTQVPASSWWQNVALRWRAVNAGLSIRAWAPVLAIAVVVIVWRLPTDSTSSPTDAFATRGEVHAQNALRLFCVVQAQVTPVAEGEPCGGQVVAALTGAHGTAHVWAAPSTVVDPPAAGELLHEPHEQVLDALVACDVEGLNVVEVVVCDRCDRAAALSERLRERANVWRGEVLCQRSAP